MIFLDLVGTISDPQKDREGMIEIGRRVKEKFSLPESPEEIWNEIDSIRRPQAEGRHINYIPFRFITADAVFMLLRDRRRKMSEEELAWAEKTYLDAQLEKAALAPNAGQGIEKMRKIAGHLGVISDADTDYLHSILEVLGVIDYFDSITSSEESGFGKPNPKIFRLALERAGNPKNAIHVGDSEKRDIDGAIASGLIPVKIGHKGTKSRARYIASDLRDAADWIEKYYNETE